MQRLVAKIKWLTTKEGRPYLLVIALGFLVGAFVSGAVGIILSTILGLALLTLLKKFKLPTKPWQATVATLLPIVARLSFMMVFFLPIADYLALPSGHTPDTLMKYLSIMVVKPANIISNAPADNVFPGIPIIVAISVILMFWGSLNLGKRKNFIIAFLGLLLYTLSPTIASVTYGYDALRIDFNFFAVGYYLAWVGLILIVLNKFLPKILGTPSKLQDPTGQTSNRLMSIMPFVALAFFLTQLHNIHLSFSIITLQDLSPGFEAAHHAVADVFTGALAGIGAGVIMDNVSPSSDSSSTDFGSNPPDQTTPPETPTAPAPPPDTTPTTLPAQEPIDIDEINQAKKQREIDEKYMSDFQKDAQKQIDEDKIKAANDDKALHDIQEHAHDETKKFWKDYYTEENEFNSWTAEHEISKAEGFEKLEHAAEYTKKGADWAIWVGKYTVPGGRQVADAYEVTQEFVESAADGKTGQGLTKAGIKIGEKLVEHYTWHTLEHSLGHESDAGKFVHYINEEGEPPEHVSIESLNDVAVDATKDKIKGLAPEQAGDYVKKKAGLEESEGESEHGESAGGEAPASGE